MYTNVEENSLVFRTGRLLPVLLRAAIYHLVGMRIKGVNSARTKMILKNCRRVNLESERDESFVFS